MKKSIIFALLFSVMLFISNCVRTDVIRLNNIAYPKVAPQNVEIYLTKQDIKNDYLKLALILSASDSYFKSYEEIVAKAKKEAAKIGANAIILQRIDKSSTLEKDSDEGLEITSEKRVKIIAIRIFKEKPKQSSLSEN